MVVDGLNNRVQRYTPEGGYLGGWGRPGTGDGELNMPWGVAVTAGGEVYVADWRNDRIQRFDADGRHLATLGSSGVGDGQFRRPAGVAVDDDGTCTWQTGATSGFRCWVRREFRGPLPGRVGPEQVGPRLLRRQPGRAGGAGEGRHGPEPDTDPSSPEYLREQSASVEKLFWGPTSVKLDGAGRMFVVESARYRIQVYQRQPRDGRMS